MATGRPVLRNHRCGGLIVTVASQEFTINAMGVGGDSILDLAYLASSIYVRHGTLSSVSHSPGNMGKHFPRISSMSTIRTA